MRLHWDVLSRAQRRLLDQTSDFLVERGFYLAGGTALALLLGHRRSVDFDWFCETPLREPLLLANALESLQVPLVVDAVEPGTLHATASGVRLSLLEYRYPLLRRPAASRDPRLRIASLQDIACMKLAAVAQRGSRKDFVDVYALGKRLTLQRMLRLYRQRYGVTDVGHVIFALSYFDDAERERMPRMLAPWRWSLIKRTLQRRVGELVR